MKNYHTHTFRCNHAEGDAEDYAKAAVDRGFRVLGFTDHTPLPDDRWPGIRMPYSELPNYVAAVKEAQRKYPELKILLGMECEWLPEYHEFFTAELLGRYQFDYLVLGSHFFPYGGEYLSSHGMVFKAQYLKAYTEHLIRSMEAGIFAFVAHPDLFGLSYKNWDENTKAAAKDILTAAAELKIPLEINGYGLCNKLIETEKGWRVAYPWFEFWQLAAEYDVEVLVNSDAHHPENIAQGLKEGAGLIENLGLTPAKLEFS